MENEPKYHTRKTRLNATLVFRLKKRVATFVVKLLHCRSPLRGTTHSSKQEREPKLTPINHRKTRLHVKKTNWGWGGVSRHSNKHAPRNIPEAQDAFKVLMIHWILQFALRIAFRCVLHRCGSQDIRRWKLYWISIMSAAQVHIPKGDKPR
jgi:hypothetical protein